MCRLVDGVLLVNMIQNANVIIDEIPVKYAQQEYEHHYNTNRFAYVHANRYHILFKIYTDHINSNDINTTLYR